MKHETCKHAGRVETVRRAYTNEDSEFALVECKLLGGLWFGSYCETCEHYDKKNPPQGRV